MTEPSILSLSSSLSTTSPPLVPQQSSTPNCPWSWHIPPRMSLVKILRLVLRQEYTPIWKIDDKYNDIWGIFSLIWFNSQLDMGKKFSLYCYWISSINIRSEIQLWWNVDNCKLLHSRKSLWILACNYWFINWLWDNECSSSFELCWKQEFADRSRY